jgi:hypothetical protein
MWDLVGAFGKYFVEKPTVTELLISMKDDRRVEKGKRAKNPIEVKIAGIAAQHLE